MQSIGQNLQRIENAIIAICFIVMTLAAFAQVMNRNFIGAGISWFDELARYCMVYLTLLATEAGLRDGSQIAITGFTDKCPPVIRRILQLIVKLIIIAFSIAICNTAMDLVHMQLRSGQVSAAMNLPMWIPYISLPIAFGLITLIQALSLLVLLKKPLESNEKKGA